MAKTQKADAVDQNPVLRITRTFDAKPERVYAAFTNPGDLEKWFGPDGVNCIVHAIDPRPGGEYSFTMRNDNGEQHPLSGVFQEVIENEKLVYTWVWETGTMAGIETRVTLEFKAVSEGTELTLTHELLASETAVKMHNVGWSGSFDCLAVELTNQPN
ncbi:MAG: SRPBCC domain-containing protein [Proteobacteria bacterium]|nr:SRPBCC domain-containing protein [Pseudomonadota bacterium]MDA1091071.1 SRPBCC domain-containing protein [Pseudomonadota bacterium]